VTIGLDVKDAPPRTTPQFTWLSSEQGVAYSSEWVKCPYFFRSHVLNPLPNQTL
jgi:hypothetical protein